MQNISSKVNNKEGMTRQAIGPRIARLTRMRGTTGGYANG